MKKKQLYSTSAALFICLIAFQLASAQTDPNIPQNTKVYTFVEVMPKYPGGESGLYKFISKNLKYPAEDLANANEGKVFVSFVVNQEGNVSDVKVERGVTEGLNAEAVRVISMLAGFTPATQGGKNVNYKYILPISFKHGLSDNQIWKIRKRQAKQNQN